jgi:hypothetical protein
VCRCAKRVHVVAKDKKSTRTIKEQRLKTTQKSLGSLAAKAAESMQGPAAAVLRNLLEVGSRVRSTKPTHSSQLHTSKRKICKPECLSREPAQHLREYVMVTESRRTQFAAALQPVDALRLAELFPARNVCDDACTG